MREDCTAVWERLALYGSVYGYDVWLDVLTCMARCIQMKKRILRRKRVRLVLELCGAFAQQNVLVLAQLAERVAMLELRRRLALGGKGRRHEHSQNLGHDLGPCLGHRHLVLQLLRALLVVRRLLVGRAPHRRAAHHRRRRGGRRRRRCCWHAWRRREPPCARLRAVRAWRF